MGFLNVIEISKKQHYIFKSNKMKENMGASKTIEYTTEELPKELCEKNSGKLISSGGGNSIFYFEKKEQSINFSKEFSVTLLRGFPSLEFFGAVEEYNEEEDKITVKIGSLFKKLEKKKSGRKQYAHIIDFGVSEKCDSTRLPAVATDIEGRYISSEARSKVRMYEKYKSQKEGNKQFAIDLKELGISKNEKSYIAITHIDGNRMGKRLNSLREKYESMYQDDNKKYVNEQYLERLKEFSDNIKTAFDRAFAKTVEAIESATDKLKNHGMKIHNDIIPIRKVILAGDDVCYITDARIALECADIFLNELEKHTVFGEKITACAGVAMVKEKYPFFRAYELSEELCANAKRSIGDIPESRIDWHIVQGEYNNNLNEIRESSYLCLDGKNLSLRPLVTTKTSNVNNHYDLFVKDIKNLKSISRGKVKGMLNQMRKGEKELDIYIEINSLYKSLGSRRYEAKTGFQENKCVLFDAVEAMDYFIPILEGE